MRKPIAFLAIIAALIIMLDALSTRNSEPQAAPEPTPMAVIMPAPIEPEHIEFAPIEPEHIEHLTPEPTVTLEPTPEPTPVPTPTPKAKASADGQIFTIYSYCPCEKCCGKWSKKDANGNYIATTASGAKAVEGVTVAADWSVLPKGTRIYIEGIGERVVQDTGVSGRTIDLYVEKHEDCAKIGKQKRRVTILNSEALGK